MPELDNKQIEGLQRLLSLLDPQTLTKEDFVSSFENVVNLVKKIEQQNIKEFEAIHEVITKLGQKLQEDNSTFLNTGKEESLSMIRKELDRIKEEHAQLMYKSDERIMSMKDGKDADEDSVAEKVYGMIKVPTIEELKDQLPVMAEEVRDALELLEGDDRLEMSAIKGLEEALEELRKRKSSLVGGGGGFSVGSMNIHLVDDETPVNSGDDTNFTIAHKPSPASSLKVYRGGARQRLTEDYTFSGQTITLLTPLNSGEILLCDYRI